LTKSNAALDKACFTPPATFPSCYDGSFLRPDTAEGWSELAEFLAGMPLPPGVLRIAEWRIPGMIFC
jgi:hypothetical protein